MKEMKEHMEENKRQQQELENRSKLEVLEKPKNK